MSMSEPPTQPTPSRMRGRHRGGPRGRKGSAARPRAAPASAPAPPPAPDASEPPSKPPSEAAPPAATRGRGRDRGRGHGAAPRARERAVPRASRGRGAARGRDRHAFGAKLTEASAEAAPFVPRATATATEHADLRSRLIAELSNDAYDCIICYNAVTRKQAVWSCTRCYSVLHLGCIRKWAEKSVQQVRERNAMHEDPAVRTAPAKWRCPGCQHARTSVPTTYTCWCGRVARPRAQAVPHACGHACTRGCVWHGCAAGTCHPGPCPPCAATVRVPCFCGKQAHVAVRCAQLHRQLPEALAALSLDEVQAAGMGAVSCGGVCGKLLACGHHTCAAPCHAGPCAPCTVTLHEAPCHCGRARRTLPCAERDAPSCTPRTSSAFSCGAVCDEAFACGVHRCTDVCHVRSAAPPPCPRDPARVRTCFCGRTSAAARTQCTDPMPACGAPCGKPRACGHVCTTPCHAGACPPCPEPIVQVCRCGAAKRTVACSAAADAYLCASVCKAQRHCARHVCNTLCCPLAYQATLSKKQAGLAPHADLHAYLEELDPAHLHACERVCGRLLACKQHTCEAPCHRGACAPCLRSSFTEVACACGRTVLEPPVPCGTEVVCTYPCTRPDPPCGHPKVPHTCHSDATPCPPCVHLTARACVCGAQVLPAVPCSREKVRCGTPCRAPLACGLHTCPGACHDAPRECPPCTQPCGRPRSVCGHACMQPCHAPAPCDEETPCEAVLVRRCACGHQEKMETCGMARSTPRRDALAPLPCTPQCKVAQRNARFASALGLGGGAGSSDVCYAPPLFAFAQADHRAACAVQEALADFVQSPRTAAQLRPLLLQQATRTGTEPRRITLALLDFAHQLAPAYRLEAEPCTEQGALRMGAATSARGADLRVRRARGARIPSPTLTEYMAANPERVKHALTTQPARGAAAASAAAAQASAAPHAAAWLRWNAIALTEVPRHILEDAACLTPLLAAAALGGKRRWRVERTADDQLVLCDVQLEPLSAAAVASQREAGPYAALSGPERRLGRLADDVNAVLRDGPIRAALACYRPDIRRVERVFAASAAGA